MKKAKSLVQIVGIPLLAGGLALGVSGCVGPGGISPQGEAVLTGLFMTAATEDIKRSVNPNQTNVNVYNNKEGRWDNERKSKLIESFLMNVPVPPVFFYDLPQ